VRKTAADETLQNNRGAYRLYMTGVSFRNQMAEEGREKSTDYFQRAIEIDPNYALAWDATELLAARIVVAMNGDRITSLKMEEQKMEQLSISAAVGRLERRRGVGRSGKDSCRPASACWPIRMER
jgi:hypothetical protein